MCSSISYGPYGILSYEYKIPCKFATNAERMKRSFHRNCGKAVLSKRSKRHGKFLISIFTVRKLLFQLKIWLMKSYLATKSMPITSNTLRTHFQAGPDYT